MRPNSTSSITSCESDTRSQRGSAIPRWRLQVFGGLRVQCESSGESLLLHGRQRELLTLLVLDRLRPRVSATRYSDALWPDSDGAAARSNLDSAIYRLRRLLGCAQALRVHEGSVWLDPDVCSTDVEELATILRAIDACPSMDVSDLRLHATHLLQLTAPGGLQLAPCDAVRPVAYLWRAVTRELVLRLDAAGHTLDAMRLCERYLTGSESDSGLLSLWVDMLERSGRSIAAEHVREEFGRPVVLM
jgi:hypothetical protein